MKKIFTFLLLLSTIVTCSFAETLYACDKLRAYAVSEDLHKNTIYLSSVKPSNLKDYFEIEFYVIVYPGSGQELTGIHTYPITFIAKKGDTIQLKNNVWSYPVNIKIDDININCVTFSESPDTKDDNNTLKNENDILLENLDWSETIFSINKETLKQTNLSLSVKIQLGFIRNDKVTAKLIQDKESSIRKGLINYFNELSEEELKIENRNDLKIKVKNYINENILYSTRIVAILLNDFEIK